MVEEIRKRGGIAVANYGECVGVMLQLEISN